MNKPKNNWISPYTIIEKVMFWREIDYGEPIVQAWKKILDPLCDGLHAFRNFINRNIKFVKIDRWDTWSMDSTLSPIILPMLKQLREGKHGAPYVDDEDVPANIRSTTKAAIRAKKEQPHDTDIHHFERWDWVMDEMIWTFEQFCMDDPEGQFYTHMTKTVDWESAKDINKSIRNIKVNKVGLKKHNDRIDNGLRLFGKYYRGLWD
jgi:hypothetical protein